MISGTTEQPSGLHGLFNLSGRVAIVTGGGSFSGIGLGIAEGLAGAQASIVVVDRADSDEALARLAAAGTQAIAIKADVTREDNWERVVRLALERFGRIDILVNNAGISLTKAPELVTLDEWQGILDVNMTGAFLGARTVYAHMKKQGGGKIVNIGSMCSIFGGAFNVPYTASKGGIMQLTRGLAVAWGKDNIQVNAILPGFIDTALSQRAKAKMPEFEEKVLVRTPAGRWGHPRDFAGIAVFLCSAASDFISGTAIPVDGGYSVQL
jgi:2-deoxy-D-gluconate 3-dehydrogenase